MDCEASMFVSAQSMHNIVHNYDSHSTVTFVFNTSYAGHMVFEIYRGIDKF